MVIADNLESLTGLEIGYILFKLENNEIGDEAAVALSTRLQRLNKLFISNNGLSQECIMRLFQLLNRPNMNFKIQ